MLTLVLAKPAYPEATVGATREIPDGKIEYTPAVPDVMVTSGQYSPRVPLEVLPGRGGMAPELSLAYSAKHANGPLGAGWYLAGESTVARKSKYGGMPQMTADDTFWIDGQKLVATADGTYRAEQNDFVIYRKVLSAGTIVGWTATKDGRVRTFGKSSANDSAAANAVEYRDEIVITGTVSGDEPVAWRLARDTSPFGASITYTYTIPVLSVFVPVARTVGTTTKRHLLHKIKYAEAGGNYNEVELGYQARSDVRASYANGPERLEAHRLRRVISRRVAGTTTIAHYYLLVYRDAVNSPQSVLTEVKRLAVDPLAPPTSMTESTASAESLARFGYSDSETTWGERQALQLVGDPPLSVDATKAYYSMSLAADVNADALPDLVIFNDKCNMKGKTGTPDPGDEDVILPQILSCDPDHRVYINTINELRVPMLFARAGAGFAVEAQIIGHNSFVYDAARSAQVTDFFGPLHTALGAMPIQIIDLGRDGYADLVKPARLSVGSDTGWSTSGVAANWSEDSLENDVFADLDGDGYPDLIGQSDYRRNTGVSPFIPVGLGVALVDPVVDGGASSQYDTADTTCLDSGDTGMHLRADYGVVDGGPNDPPDLGPSITADQWVWRNTVNADFNGDGMMDRLISFPFLRYETSVESPGAAQLWVRDDEECGQYDQLFFGDGRGKFIAAGYGIGGPMSRSQQVVQVRTLDDINSTTITHSYHANHFAMSDVDADGRNEVTQYCNNESTFVALWDRGVESDDGGYGVEAPMPSCPTDLTASVPETFFGLSMLDYHYSTMADVDGDGMSDLLMYSHPYGDPDEVVSNTNTPWATWGEGPHWRRNQRSTAQNRLVSVTGPHGGVTSVTWAWSAEDPNNHFAINVEHVASVTTANGRTAYSFENGSFDDGEFGGFGRVETFLPRGATLVETFLTSRALRNKRSTEELYDTGGRLKTLRVHLHGSEDPTVSPFGGGFGWDGIAPYYNPELRRCEYEFGYLNAKAPLGTDIDSYIAKCEAFEEEPGGFVSVVFTERSLHAVVRGRDPVALAKSPAERRELVALRDLLAGRDPRAICAPQSGDNSLLQPRVCRRFTTTPGDLASSTVFGADSGPSTAVTFSAAPLFTRMDVSFSATDLATWVPHGLIVKTERGFVNEYSYDTAHGHVLQHRELRDITTRSDSLIHDYTYSTFDPAFAGRYLTREVTTNRSGQTFEEIDYEDFIHGMWRRRVVHDTLSVSTRTDRRTLTNFGDISGSSDALDHWSSFEYSTCGPQTSALLPNQLGSDQILDGSCRATTERKKFGSTVIARTTFTRDHHGRVTAEVTNPAYGVGGMPLVTLQHAYDADSTSTQPTSVTIAPEPDGTSTLTKVYADAHGRPIKHVRCAAAAGGGGSGLDATYPCDPETEVVTETTYDASTGDMATVVGPYLASDTLRPTTQYTHDEFGRRVVVVDPLNATTTYDYGLGRRAVIDSIGRRTEVMFDTLSEDVFVDGVSRGGTRRDAFGRVTATIDAAGGQSDFYYDGYNRKREERAPAVNVLASGAASTVSQRPTTLYTYDRADRMLTRQDPNGRVTSFTYDAGGRPLTTTGPDITGDGVPDVLETRSYVEGGYGTRKVTIRNAMLGDSREEHLDGLGRTWKEVAFDGTVTQTEFDMRGRPWRVTLPWGEVRTTVKHDAGMTEVVTARQGSVISTTTTQFDAGGRPTSVTDADGQVITNEYDLAGRLLTMWQGSRELKHHVYDSAGRVTQRREAGALTCLSYDRFDRVTFEEVGCVTGGFIVNPSSGRGLINIVRTYTALDQLDTQVDGTGTTIDHDYDAGGRRIATELFDATNASRGRRTFDHDAVGNQTRVIDELGLVSRTAYDAIDRVVSVDPPEANPTTTAYVVDGENWVATTTAPTGEHSIQEVDAMGRTVRACAPDQTCVLTSYVDGLLTSRSRGTEAGAISAIQFVDYYPSSNRVHREWDWIGIGEITLACGGDAPDGCPVPFIERTWTTSGRADMVIDAQGNVTEYQYLADGSLLLSSVSQSGLPTITFGYSPQYPRLSQRIIDNTTGGTDIVETTTWERNLRLDRVSRALNLLQEVTTYDYDGAGRRTLGKVTRGTESIEITDAYDVRSNPVSRIYAVRTTAGNYDGTLAYQWRDNGQLANMTLPSGKLINYTHDGATGRMLNVGYGAAQIFEARDHDTSGRPVTLRYDGGAVRVVRTFDTAGRIGARDVFGTTPTRRTETFGYDAQGRLSRIDVVSGVNTASSVFGYNTRDRLTSETHTSNALTREIGYGYEPVTGLRTTKTDSSGGPITTTTYTYVEGNRLAMVDAAPIAWDGFGRQTSDAAGRVFAFGLSNQLLSIQEAGAVVESNYYDASGLRIARTTPAGGFELFLSDHGGKVVERIAGTAITDYISVSGGETVATIDATGNVTPVVESITGSPYRIGESSGDHLYVDATAFGETITVAGALLEPLGFHGMFASEADEIKIAGVRAYDTTTGRFLTADPLGLDSAPEGVDAADLFRYSQDNPVSLSDPTGYAPMPNGKMQNPCLMTADGGCRPREQSYEEQREAASQAWLADKMDQERVFHDRFVQTWKKIEKAGLDPRKVFALATDAKAAEAVEALAARHADVLEMVTEPASSGAAGLGGGPNRVEQILAQYRGATGDSRPMLPLAASTGGAGDGVAESNDPSSDAPQLADAYAPGPLGGIAAALTDPLLKRIFEEGAMTTSESGDSSGAPLQSNIDQFVQVDGLTWTILQLDRAGVDEAIGGAVRGAVDAAVDSLDRSGYIGGPLWFHLLSTPAYGSRGAARAPIASPGVLLLTGPSGRRPATIIRNSAGVAWGANSGVLRNYGSLSEWMRGGGRVARGIPLNIAQALDGQSFRNFGEFRAEFWRLVALDPVVGVGWRPSNHTLMLSGRAPHTSFGVGARTRYELDHIREIQDYGIQMVYYLPNIRVVSASFHLTKFDVYAPPRPSWAK